MGTFQVKIRVANPANPGEAREVEAWVDSGASFSQLPASLLAELGVPPGDEEEFGVADGRTVRRRLAEVRLFYDGRQATSVVIIGGPGDPVLLGAHGLEGLRLAVDPVERRLMPHRPWPLF